MTLAERLVRQLAGEFGATIHIEHYDAETSNTSGRSYPEYDYVTIYLPVGWIWRAKGNLRNLTKFLNDCNRPAWMDVQDEEGWPSLLVEMLDGITRMENAK